MPINLIYLKELDDIEADHSDIIISASPKIDDSNFYIYFIKRKLKVNFIYMILSLQLGSEDKRTSSYYIYQ